MSGVYADVTGPGSETAARLAIADFGGNVLGRPITLQVADHQNKADVAAAIATEWFDANGVTALLDVAASSPALAVMNVANLRNKIVMLNGPGAASITNEACIATAVHYTYNTYATAHAVTKAVMEQGGKSWFYLTADYTFGHQLEKRQRRGRSRPMAARCWAMRKAPIDTSDFSSFLLQAQQSQAQVIGLANAGADLINTVSRQREFGITKKLASKLASLGAEINDIHGIGLNPTPGCAGRRVLLGHRRSKPERFASRFNEKLHKMPNMLQAGHVFFRDALSAGGAGGRCDGQRPGDGENADDAGERFLRARRSCLGGWADGARHVPVSGGDAGEMKGPWGLLHERLDDPG